jgi:hypothetical protein
LLLDEAPGEDAMVAGFRGLDDVSDVDRALVWLGRIANRAAREEPHGPPD